MLENKHQKINGVAFMDSEFQPFLAIQMCFILSFGVGAKIGYFVAHPILSKHIFPEFQTSLMVWHSLMDWPGRKSPRINI